jgi:pimeloyl-ACP methyl ester carboxylesterase
MRSIADAVPNAQFVEIPASGHMTTMENPAAVNTALLQFIKQLALPRNTNA